jgi:hypothetical protein
MSAPRTSGAIAGMVILAGIATLSPPPDRITDRGVYEATAQAVIVPDCTDLHCFRVLVPWVLGRLPGSSDAKWKAYSVLANGAAAVGVFRLASALGLATRGAGLAAALSMFGFGSLYTLHDPFTADPLMYALGPWLTLLLLQGKVIAAGTVAALGVLAKEFAAAPLYIFALFSAIERRWLQAGRVVIAANTAFLVWLTLQFTLMLRFNYGYGDNPSTQLLSGGYLRPWLEQQSSRGAASALFNVYGAAYLLMLIGLVFAPTQLRRLALAALPIVLLFAYVQQPDRALWNAHYLVLPLAAATLQRVPAPLGWALVGTYAVANLRVGAQLPWIPEARFATGMASALAIMASLYAWQTRRLFTPLGEAREIEVTR